MSEAYPCISVFCSTHREKRENAENGNESQREVSRQTVEKGITGGNERSANKTTGSSRGGKVFFPQLLSSSSHLFQRKARHLTTLINIVVIIVWPIFSSLFPLREGEEERCASLFVNFVRWSSCVTAASGHLCEGREERREAEKRENREEH